MKKVLMAVTQTIVTLVEVPANLSETMRVDRAISAVGRSEGSINKLIGSSFGMGIMPMGGQTKIITATVHKSNSE